MNVGSVLRGLAPYLFAVLTAGTPILAHAQEIVTLSRYEPASNGWVISNPQFKIAVSVHDQGTDFAKVEAHVNIEGGAVEGYKYNGTLYTEGNKGEWCTGEGSWCHTTSLGGDITDVGHLAVRINLDVTHQGRTVGAASNEIAGTINGGSLMWRQEGIGADHRRSDYAITNLRISSTQHVSTENVIKSALRDTERAETRAKQTSSASDGERSDGGSTTSASRSPDTYASTPASRNSATQRPDPAAEQRRLQAEAQRRQQAEEQRRQQAEAQRREQAEVDRMVRESERRAAESTRKFGTLMGQYAEQRRRNAAHKEQLRQQREAREAKAAAEAARSRARTAEAERQFHMELDGFLADFTRRLQANDQVGSLEQMIDRVDDGTILYLTYLYVSESHVFSFNQYKSKIKYGTKGRSKGKLLVNERSHKIVGQIVDDVLDVPYRVPRQARISLVLAASSEDELERFVRDAQPGSEYRYAEVGELIEDKWGKTLVRWSSPDGRERDYDDLSTEAKVNRYADHLRLRTALAAHPDFADAVKGSHIEAVRAHLEFGDADVSLVDDEGNPPLLAVPNATVARLLIEHGADVNAIGPSRQTPLHRAAANNDLEVVRVLLDAGADPDARTAGHPGFKPLFYASSGSDVHTLLKEHEAAQPGEEDKNSMKEHQADQDEMLVHPSCRPTTQLAYPTAAKAAGVEGQVLVSFVVEQNGQVTGAYVTKTSNNADLNNEALRYARGLSCSAGQQGEKNVPVRMVLPVGFALK